MSILFVLDVLNAVKLARWVERGECTLGGERRACVIMQSDGGSRYQLHHHPHPSPRHHCDNIPATQENNKQDKVT